MNAIATWVRRCHVPLLSSLGSPTAACLYRATTSTQARWGLFPAWIGLFPHSCPVLASWCWQPLGCSRTAQLLLGSLRSPALCHLCPALAMQAPKQDQLMHRGCASPALSWLQPQDAEQACGQFSLPHRASPRAGMGFPVYLRRQKASPRASVEHFPQPHVDSLRHQPWQPMALPGSS